MNGNQERGGKEKKAGGREKREKKEDLGRVIFGRAAARSFGTT